MSSGFITDAYGGVTVASAVKGVAANAVGLFINFKYVGAWVDQMYGEPMAITIKLPYFAVVQWAVQLAMRAVLG